eukprot:XP_011671881.1 PREDICTED: uncharacterized protein LOC100893530 [Strongylocentrotus purpuratus]
MWQLSQAIQYADFKNKTKVTKYFALDLTEESDETFVTLELIHTSTQTIKFNTRFQEVISLPTTNEGWLEVAGDFEARWNLPHCLGGYDGKHIRLQKPNKSGSLYFNYKQFFSVVLMALVDSKYQYLWIDVGGVGHQSDAQIYNNSELKECIEAGTLGIPDPAPLPHDDEEHPMPYFFVGDYAFAMRTYMMKPYGRRNMDQQQKIFNYRLSRASASLAR